MTMRAMTMIDIDEHDSRWDAPLTQEQWNAAKWMFEDRSAAISA